MNILKYPNINWSLPILFSNDEYVFAISSIMERLNVKNPITEIYGMVPSVWTGSRLSKNYSQDTNKIEKLLNKIIEIGVTPAFTFTKYDIELDDLKNNFCNWLLEFGVEHNCEFIIASDMLFDHIKSKYPQSKCISSNTKPIFELKLVSMSETEYYNNLLSKFDKVNIRPEYAKTTLNQEYTQLADISRIEVTINDTCIPDCPSAPKEYLEIPKKDLDIFYQKGFDEQSFSCPREDAIKKDLSEFIKSPSLLFSESEINNLINKIGIKNLKLKGYNYEMNSNIRLMNNYIFEEAGDFQNILPLIYGYCKNSKTQGVLSI